MAEIPPPLVGILETALYHRPGQREAMERFYGEVLGLRAVTSWPDGVAFRLGDGVLLLFDAEAVSANRDEATRHGAAGPGHACLRAARGDYEAWKAHLPGAGVTIDEETTWRNGRRSFYFRDPAGNSLEIAEDDIWPE
jgi:catechol 2,3-dioxygenase-like lactoylglutathione lyase family enzyme